MHLVSRMPKFDSESLDLGPKLDDPFFWVLQKQESQTPRFKNQAYPQALALWYQIFGEQGF